MGITLTKKRYLLWTTIFALVSGVGVYYAIELLFPGHYFKGYPAIPVYFYIFGWYYIYSFDMCRRYTPNKILSVYLGMKVVKMLLSMLFLLFYILFVKVQKEDFVLTFFLFYLFTLLHESIFFYLFEQNLKKKKEKKNE